MKLYGRNSVLERIRINPRSVRNIAIEKGQDLREFEHLCRLKNIPLRYLSEREIDKITRNIRCQGIVAEVEDFQYSDFEDILEQPKENLPRPYVQGRGLPTVLFLDNLNDPQNLGSILRSAAGFGGFAVVLPKHDSVEITETVLRIACGGENYVSVSQVTNLSWALEAAKKQGYWIAGAVTEDGEDLTRVNFHFPLGLVIGSEAKGIRQGLLKHLDFRLTIPMPAKGLSFNVAVAAAIFCYEASRQRQ